MARFMMTLPTPAGQLPGTRKHGALMMMPHLWARGQKMRSKIRKEGLARLRPTHRVQRPPGPALGRTKTVSAEAPGKPRVRPPLRPTGTMMSRMRTTAWAWQRHHSTQAPFPPLHPETLAAIEKRDKELEGDLDVEQLLLQSFRAAPQTDTSERSYRIGTKGSTKKKSRPETASSGSQGRNH